MSKMSSSETSSGCLVARGDTMQARPKRPRGQAIDSGMEVENPANSNGQSHLNSNGGSGDHKMEVDSYSSAATNGDRSSGESHNQNYKRSPPKQVTDDSCESEDTEKGKPSHEGCSSQADDSVRHPQHEQREPGTPQHDNRAGETTNGLHKESDQQSSATADVKLSLPQHEQQQGVNPPDISYRSTPASLKLREALFSRLQLIAPTGRIQVVSHLLC